MFLINDDMSIYVTRGDAVFFTVEAEENGKQYTFKAGDVVRFKVFAKKDCEVVVLSKDFAVTEDTTSVSIELTKADTKIGEVISKPVDYWYEVELNPLTTPQTIIGYDDDGAKVFKLYPEGDDIEDTPIEPEDIPIVDAELDATSTRPIQNQAVAKEFTKVKQDYVKFTDVATKDKAGVVKVGGDSAGVKLNADGLLVVSSAGTKEIQEMASANRPITPYYLKWAIKTGLVKNDLEWTDAEKKSARDVLGIEETGGSGEGLVGTELTQAEYDALPEEEQNNGLYFITDGVYTERNADNGESSAIDYIVEQSTSGIWTYRKWNSGIAECWGCYQFTTSLTVAWGQMYESPDIKIPAYPFAFVEAPIVQISPHISDRAFVVEGGTAYGDFTTQPPNFWILRGVKSTTTENFQVGVHALGRWK